MVFQNCIIDKKMIHAIKWAQLLLKGSSPMVLAILQKDDWRFNSGKSTDIILKLLTQRDPVNVFSYRPWNPFSKAIAYTDGKAIYFNIKKLDDISETEIVGCLLHEYAHICGFTHGNNFPSEEKNDYSVPYYLSQNVKKWV